VREGERAQRRSSGRMQWLLHAPRPARTVVIRCRRRRLAHIVRNIVLRHRPISQGIGAEPAGISRRARPFAKPGVTGMPTNTTRITCIDAGCPPLPLTPLSQPCRPAPPESLASLAQRAWSRRRSA
jgi:hypothetical protein